MSHWRAVLKLLVTDFYLFELFRLLFLLTALQYFIRPFLLFFL